MYVVTLKKGKENRAMKHPWIYANEVQGVSGKDKKGSIARVQSFDGRLIGFGFINHLSKIFIRIISRKEEVFDKDFFAVLVKKAIEKRTLLGYSEACRLIFGESDFLPGLIVDKYGDYLSMQVLCLGMELIKNDIIDILVELLKPRGIYERSDVSSREKEGLKQYKGVVYGEVPDKVSFVENGIKISIDIANGQKTGYFLDQQRNRARVADYSKDKEVLDCFSNVGGFALNASKGGAKSVLALDVSELAVEAIRENARNNSLKIDVERADVFEKLRALRKEGIKYDLIVLDPPAFIKNVDSVKNGYNGYKDINVLAMKLLKDNGILFTCSCSQHLTLEMFLQMLRDSAYQASTNMSLLELSIQGSDHASNILEEEALYLKVAILRKNG